MHIHIHIHIHTCVLPQNLIGYVSPPENWQRWRMSPQCSIKPIYNLWNQGNQPWNSAIVHPTSARAAKSSLQPGLTPVQRADVFRYLVLWDQGGYYADVDAACTLPIDQYQIPKDPRRVRIQTWSGQSMRMFVQGKPSVCIYTNAGHCWSMFFSCHWWKNVPKTHSADFFAWPAKSQLLNFFGRFKMG